MYIGRIARIKGLDILLEAFAKLPNEKIVIAGTGSQLEEYKRKATRNIKFVGFLNRTELSNCLSKAKAVIIPSQWYETFGMIIAEAYAAHKPVIVGNIGNIVSLVEDKVIGLCFDYSSAEALKNTIIRMKKADAEAMGENAYKKYMAEFTPKRNYFNLKKIYDFVTNK